MNAETTANTTCTTNSLKRSILASNSNSNDGSSTMKEQSKDVVKEKETVVMDEKRRKMFDVEDPMKDVCKSLLSLDGDDVKDNEEVKANVGGVVGVADESTNVLPLLRDFSSTENEKDRPPINENEIVEDKNVNADVQPKLAPTIPKMKTGGDERSFKDKPLWNDEDLKPFDSINLQELANNIAGTGNVNDTFRSRPEIKLLLQRFKAAAKLGIKPETFAKRLTAVLGYDVAKPVIKEEVVIAYKLFQADRRRAEREAKKLLVDNSAIASVQNSGQSIVTVVEDVVEKTDNIAVKEAEMIDSKEGNNKEKLNVSETMESNERKIPSTEIGDKLMGSNINMEMNSEILIAKPNLYSDESDTNQSKSKFENSVSSMLVPEQHHIMTDTKEVSEVNNQNENPVPEAVCNVVMLETKTVTTHSS